MISPSKNIYSALTLLLREVALMTILLVSFYVLSHRFMLDVLHLFLVLNI